MKHTVNALLRQVRQSGPIVCVDNMNSRHSRCHACMCSRYRRMRCTAAWTPTLVSGLTGSSPTFYASMFTVVSDLFRLNLVLLFNFHMLSFSHILMALKPYVRCRNCRISPNAFSGSTCLLTPSVLGITTNIPNKLDIAINWIPRNTLCCLHYWSIAPVSSEQSASKEDQNWANSV